MCAIRAASAALLCAAVLVLAPPAPPALAAPRSGAVPPTVADREDGRFLPGLNPPLVAAGGVVTLSARGCPGDTTVSSDAFGVVTLHAHSGPGTATVHRGARAGTGYRVVFACADGTALSRELTVAGGHGGGEGGAVRHAARTGATGALGGFDLQEIGVGAALLGAALVLAYRRARRHGAAARETTAERGGHAGRPAG
ncbi:hypothetical protein GCM10018793_06740 [Streptomyces sulfonofaciens]|uniref:Lipoprotein n=1 Tax=Streptomyces sulfonofaciens TaxID=68272 RepID=A0A919FT07_9ACTN|nr:hypothetical protein [Streptomyces sulfonofaciens]GHH71493.1 hypothetical protein GCM10018793_06740 [Streptomyces sulfonofaciens]